jgi:hypothetical protein
MSPTKLFLAGKNKLFPATESLVGDIPAGDGKITAHFLQCTLGSPSSLYVGFDPSQIKLQKSQVFVTLAVFFLLVLSFRHPTFTPWTRERLMPQELVRRVLDLGNTPVPERYPGYRRGTLDLSEECGQVSQYRAIFREVFIPRGDLRFPARGHIFSPLF